MAYKEYDGMEIGAAVAKLKSKVAFDEEDKAFARARAEFFTPEELSVITGDELPEDAGAKAPEGNDANASSPSDTGAQTDADAEGVDLVDESLKLDELQAIAAEAGLDTSGRKADLIERINAFRKEAKSTAAE